MELVSREDVTSPEVENIGPKFIKVRQLPSKFLGYPEGFEIHYKPYSFSELEEWSNSDMMDEEEKIQLGLKGIKTTGFDKLDLDYNDYVYIQILRKLSTFDDSRFNIPFLCPFCSTNVVDIKDLSELDFSDLEVSKLPVSVTLKTGQKLSFTNKTIRKYLFELSIEEDSRPVTTELSVKVSNMEFEEAMEIISSITDGDDMSILGHIHDILDFGDNTISCMCSNCSKESTLTLQGVSALAEPFREDTKSVQNRIVFG